MFSITVRDSMMVAHSLTGAVFGPAQNLHGATFVVEASFYRQELDVDGIVVDISRAGTALQAILKPLKYRNLDDIPEFSQINTTAEYLCYHIFKMLYEQIMAGKLGGDAHESITRLRIRLRETPDAWAEYEAALH